MAKQRSKAAGQAHAHIETYHHSSNKPSGSSTSSSKIILWGFAANISSNSATIKFKGYGIIQQVEVFYDTQWKKQQWKYIQSSPLMVSPTNNKYYSVNIEDLRPSTCYSVFVQLKYKYNTDKTRSEPIKFQTKPSDIDLGKTGLILKSLKIQPKIHFPIFKYTSTQTLEFCIQNSKTNRVDNYTTNINITKLNIFRKLNKKMVHFSYVFAKRKQFLYIQLFDSKLNGFHVYECVRKNNPVSMILNAYEKLTYTNTYCVTQSIKLKKTRSLIYVDALINEKDVRKLKYHNKQSKAMYQGLGTLYSNQLTIDDNYNYLLSYTQFEGRNGDRYKIIHVIKLTNKMRNINDMFEIHRSSQWIGDASTFMYSYRSKLLFFTQIDPKKYYQLCIAWNYDHLDQKMEIIGQYLNGVSVLVLEILSYIADPWNYVKNSYIVEFPRKPKYIWMDKENEYINVCFGDNVSHVYCIKQRKQRVVF